MKSQEFDFALSQALIAAQDYREFLKEAFRLHKEFNPTFSYATFAKRAEFSSRSFARDVIIGQKRMTAVALPKFIKGLGLRGVLKDAFIYLVGLQERDVAIDLPTRLRTERALDRLKEHLQGKGSPLSQKVPDNIFKDFQWTLVFAALGDHLGASVESVVQKTGLPDSHVRQCLKEFVHYGVATYDVDQNRYIAGDPSLVLTKLGNSDFFKSYFLYSLQLIRQLASRNFADTQSLFFNATVSIHSDELQKIRDELRGIALQFLERHENPNGTALCHLNIGWIRHPRNPINSPEKNP